MENGIDRDLLEATLNKFEFIFREGGGTQKAIIYYIRALNSWLYDQSPLDALYYNDVLSEVKEKLDGKFVENYIKEKLIDNNYSVNLSARPELDKNEREEKELREKLKTLKEKMKLFHLLNFLTLTKKSQTMNWKKIKLEMCFT